MSSLILSPASLRDKSQGESPWPQRLLLAAVLAFLVIFLVLPLVCIFAQALRKGLAAYWAAISDPAALTAV
ncbi:MAG: sulfate/thiosulfate ABC transporter permease CysW, partial [Planctomycetota bacterium]|nr:sulfate/thiosulfate ABC transporter permease CysW [Planctomycetota bacterium]